MPMGTSNSSTKGGTIRASWSFFRSFGSPEYSDQKADMVPAAMPAGRCLWNSM